MINSLASKLIAINSRKLVALGGNPMLPVLSGCKTDIASGLYICAGQNA
jgi:hypothetical protein